MAAQQQAAAALQKKSLNSAYVCARQCVRDRCCCCCFRRMLHFIILLTFYIRILLHIQKRNETTTEWTFCIFRLSFILAMAMALGPCVGVAATQRCCCLCCTHIHTHTHEYELLEHHFVLYFGCRFSLCLFFRPIALLLFGRFHTNTCTHAYLFCFCSLRRRRPLSFHSLFAVSGSVPAAAARRVVVASAAVRSLPLALLFSHWFEPRLGIPSCCCCLPAYSALVVVLSPSALPAAPYLVVVVMLPSMGVVCLILRAQIKFESLNRSAAAQQQQHL